jgi:dUTP pyrophosphatase
MMAIPPGFEGQVRARSGHARNAGISVTNGVGTIDSDFRGHLEVLLINHGTENFGIKPLMKIAQFIIAPIVQVEPEFVDELDETERGTGGFGSTNVGTVFQPFFKGEKPNPG